MFEKELLTLESKIKTTANQTDLVAFYGSSSIRLWSTLKKDLAPINCINLGFGGSTIVDCIAEADRILYPLKPLKVYFYVGDNDIGNGASTLEVFQNFQTLFNNTLVALPSCEITYVSIKPSPSRDHLRSIIESANMLIQEFIETKENCSFLNIYDDMILPNGKVNPDLFVEDNLHLNEKGYELWTKLFRESLSI